MQSTLVKISQLKNNHGQVPGLPSNPRFIKDERFEKLVKSLKDDPEMLGLREVIAYDYNGELVVIAGNMRLKACQRIGIKEVPTKILPADTSVEKLKAYTIKDNVPFGETDWSMIANEWDTEQVTEWGLDIPDFPNNPDAQEDDYEIPDEITTDIVLGDLFEIGPHRLLCGDSTQTDTFTRLLGQQMADMVITDPPYNVAIQGGDHGNPGRKNGKKIENDSISDEDFYQFLYDFYTALASYTKPGGVWYVWYASRESVNFHKAMSDAGITPKQDLIWLKSSIVMGRQDYQWKHEPCIYGWKEGAAHGWYSDRKQTTILEFDRPSRNAEHPTMKPIPLFGYQIGNSSKQGDIVVDAFGGSGTTMVACHQMGRKAYLVEYDPKYCQVIVDRMRKLDPAIEIKRNGQLYKTDE